VCAVLCTLKYMEHYQFPPAYLKQAIMVYSPPPPLPLLIFTIVVEDCLVNMTCTSNRQVQNKTFKKLPTDHSVFLVIPYHTSSNISAVSQTILFLFQKYLFFKLFSSSYLFFSNKVFFKNSAVIAM
jgi:hypothetical protein